MVRIGIYFKGDCLKLYNIEVYIFFIIVLRKFVFFLGDSIRIDLFYIIVLYFCVSYFESFIYFFKIIVSIFCICIK